MKRHIFNRIINESIDEMIDGIIDDELSKAHDDRMISDRDYAFRNAHFPDKKDWLPIDDEGDILDNDDLYCDFGDNTREFSGIDPQMDDMFTYWEHSPYNQDGDYQDIYRKRRH